MKKLILFIGALLLFVILKAQEPKFEWARSFDGEKTGYGSYITLDASGNIYITGPFEGTVDFDPGIGTFNLTDAGASDIFILKLDALGNFVWARRMGGALREVVNSIVVDKWGDIYTIGYFYGRGDYDPGVDSFNMISMGLTSVFISKLDAKGNFKWAATIGDEKGLGYASANDITIDIYGNLLITGGFFYRCDFDPSPSTKNIRYSQSSEILDLYILKLDVNGNFVWARTIGKGPSAEDAWGKSIDVDGLGNVYTTGEFSGIIDFDSGLDTFLLSTYDDNVIFILKLDADGNFVWAKKIGGEFDDVGMEITTNESGDIYTTGWFNGTVDFDPGLGIFNLRSLGKSNIFVHKMSQSTGGLNENNLTKNISIYPNPATEILVMESMGLNNSELKIQILNSLGQIVIEEKEIQHSQFNIQHLSEGLYLVRVISDNQIIATQKIIKQ